MLIDSAHPSLATCVLAHGAGAGHDAPVISALAHGLSAQGLTVVRFDFPFMARSRSSGRRQPPSPFPELVEAYLDVVARLKPMAPLFVAGKSLGARVAAAVAERVDARGVLAFGFPFHPPRAPSKLRVDLLRALRVPCLVTQGTRDPFGTRAEVESYGLGPPVQLHWLGDADHDFTPPKRGGGTRAALVDEACRAAGAFVRALV